MGALTFLATGQGVIGLFWCTTSNDRLSCQFRIAGCWTVPNKSSDAAAASVGGETASGRVRTRWNEILKKGGSWRGTGPGKPSPGNLRQVRHPYQPVLAREREGLVAALRLRDAENPVRSGVVDRYGPVIVDH